jgi:hypothetical protein
MNGRVSSDPLQLAVEEREVKEEGEEEGELEEGEGEMRTMPPPSQSHNSSCNNTRLQFSIANIMGFDVRGEPREKEEEVEEEEEEMEMGVQVESSSSHGSDMAKEWLSLTIYCTKLFLVSKKVESSSSHGSEMAKEWLSLTIYKVVLRK